MPIDEMNRPRGAKDAALRIPPSGPEVKTLFAGWGGEPATCRKCAPTARNYTASKEPSRHPAPTAADAYLGPGLGDRRASGHHHRYQDADLSLQATEPVAARHQ
ncbi:hypothetical protein GCM10010230_25400 [Streptomyces narbonensis]|nr:hypothetical protein GCM10010230_25400 [Streptomyces narbonensis]